MSLIAHTVSSIGRVRIGTVAVDEVDEVDLHPLERALHRVHQVLAVQGVLHVGHAAVDAPEELGREHEAVARPAELLHHATHDRLALAAGVGLGVVEEVAAGVVRGLHALERGVVLQLVVEGDPRPERQHRHLEAAAAEPAVLHLLLQFVARGGHAGEPSAAPHLGRLAAAGAAARGQRARWASTAAAQASAWVSCGEWYAPVDHDHGAVGHRWRRARRPGRRRGGRVRRRSP